MTIIEKPFVYPAGMKWTAGLTEEGSLRILDSASDVVFRDGEYVAKLPVGMRDPSSQLNLRNRALKALGGV